MGPQGAVLRGCMRVTRITQSNGLGLVVGVFPSHQVLQETVAAPDGKRLHIALRADWNQCGSSGGATAPAARRSGPAELAKTEGD